MLPLLQLINNRDHVAGTPSFAMELNYTGANELLARNANYEKVICGGTTAHSRLKIPLVCDASSTCNVSPTDQVGQQASLII